MSRFSNDDITFMRLALRYADKARGCTFPNPAVGAVIVKNNKMLATGSTQCCGGHHAEVSALKKAGSHAKGATLYVTLEPCCHFGRTPPCTDAIIAAGITRVVVGIKDPNPLVAGKGLAQLKKAGISVDIGCLKKDAEEQHENFIFSIQAKRPWVTIKLALTLDGCVADTTGSSQWITGPLSRRYVHDLRRCHAGIVVGRKTLLTDDPALTVRHVKGPSPIRIVFSSDEYTGLDKQFRMTARTQRSIIVVPGTPKKSISFAEDGVEIWKTGCKKGITHLRTFLDMAYSEGITALFIEGGATLASAFLEAGLVNRLYLFYGNCLIGGGHYGITYKKPLPLARATTLKNMSIMTFKDTIALTGLVTTR